MSVRRLYVRLGGVVRGPPRLRLTFTELRCPGPGQYRRLDLVWCRAAPVFQPYSAAECGVAPCAQRLRFGRGLRMGSQEDLQFCLSSTVVPAFPPRHSLPSAASARLSAAAVWMRIRQTTSDRLRPAAVPWWVLANCHYAGNVFFPSAGLNKWEYY